MGKSLRSAFGAAQKESSEDEKESEKGREKEAEQETEQETENEAENEAEKEAEKEAENKKALAAVNNEVLEFKQENISISVKDAAENTDNEAEESSRRDRAMQFHFNVVENSGDNSVFLGIEGISLLYSHSACISA